MTRRISTGWAGRLLALCMLLSAAAAWAMPPNPDLLDSVADGRLQPTYYMAHHDDLLKRGVCQPTLMFQRAVAKHSIASSVSAATPFRILAILVQFTDHPSQVPATFFDSLVFSDNGSTVKHYFNEISNAQIDLVTLNLPSSMGWRTAPQTYAYYVGGQNGLGTYPTNAQKMVEDIVDQVDPLVDFKQYDNDKDGYVDVVMVIHAGRGAEQSGSNADIWSHKWAINPRHKDGVYVSDYTMQPEYWTSPGDMTIGVYAHELSHGFGLPDLYDTDGSSNGIGRWCIMAYGSWNGPASRGGSPAHPCAWSRIAMGFASSTNVGGTLTNQAIAPVEQSGKIYRLWTSGATGPEYFLVENRQPIGYDSYLPGSGLLIWHIDESKLATGTPNDFEWYPGLPMAAHYGVALVQADGLYQLEHKANAGDASDPWPGLTNNVTFDDSSTPSALGYNGLATGVQVSNISFAGQTAFANLVSNITSGTDDGPSTSLPTSVELSQNFPNPFNPTTTISFALPGEGHVTLQIYSIAGRKVRTLYDSQAPAGLSTLEWDAKDDWGKPASSGVYLYKLTSEGKSLTRKMVLVR